MPFSVHDAHFEASSIDEVSQQLLSELQQAVTPSTHNPDMSRQKPGKVRAPQSSKDVEPSRKRRRIGEEDQEEIQSIKRSTRKTSRAHIEKTHTTEARVVDDMQSLSENDAELESRASSRAPSADHTLKQPQKQATLKRFGSEDPDTLAHGDAQEVEDEEATPLEVADPEDSESDAPEEAITGKAQDRVGIAETKAATADARARDVKRAKRKEHEQRMKEQASTSKKARVESATRAEEAEEVDGSDDQSSMEEARRESKYATLPTLLPEELLASDFKPQLNVPSPAQHAQDSKQRKQKLLLDKQDKRPKDLVHGNTRVRVLAEQPSTLPPKSTSANRRTREAWILGRRGVNEKVWTPRVSQSNGFVRNPKKPKTK